MHPTLTLLLIAGLSAGSLSAQSAQTLPFGFQSTPGNSWDPYYPFGGDAERWQWHYDDAEFLASGPILITEVYVRTAGGSFPTTFAIPDMEILMASSPTEYWVGSHDPVFDNNLNADATVVRTGPFSGTNVPMLTWMPLGMTTPFLYDPSAGNDFVVQMRTCVGYWWDVSLDFQDGWPLANGGNTYGHPSSCTATTATLLQYDETVPILLIDYEPVQVAPAISLVGTCGALGSGVTGSGMTPYGLVALGYSTQAGSSVLTGPACAGTVIDLLAPTVRGVDFADVYGDAQALPGKGIPPQACGRVHLQAIDLSTCLVSNVLSL